MSGKTPRPMIGKLTELLVSGNRAGEVLPESGASPRSPLDFKIQSPRGVKNGYNHLGGVGLGILAALERSENCRRAVCWSKLNRLDAIPANCGINCGGVGAVIVKETEALENFTYVTCRGPDRKSVTKIYYDGGDQGGSGRFDEIKESSVGAVDDFAAYQSLDFLSSCNLCRKMLHGKDIYMYRGEKAFCSTECRARQIAMDERQERCRSEAKLSSSPCNAGQIFSTGILAI